MKKSSVNILNIIMKTSDREEMATIYESLDFKSTFGDDYDPQIEQMKAEIMEVCHALEHKLEGTISYYKHHKEKYFNNPRDKNNYDALKNMLRHFREPLYPYQEYRL
jgi:hypothetical protein